jgi:K+-sensing histidine kinase KdpD
MSETVYGERTASALQDWVTELIEQRTAIYAAILGVTALTHGEAVKTGVTVATQLADDAPPIRCDRVQLQQVMLNLIVNAIQSMSGVEGGKRELHISTARIEPEGVCVAVRDTGRWAAPGEPAASLRTLLDHEARRHGHGPLDLPLDHRSPWRAAVGDQLRAAGRSLSVYDSR